MARRKRIPYKPDAFQSQGRRFVSALLDRGKLIAAVLVLAVAAFVVATVLASIRNTAEEGAWSAFAHAGGDGTKLRAAIAEYGSCTARPFMLFSLARMEIEPPQEDGKPKPEKAEVRSARLSRVEDSLRELLDDYPDHFLYLHALCLKGQLAEERGEYRDAAAIFETARVSAPRRMDPKLRYDIGRNYYLAGMPKEARSHLELAAAAGRKVYGKPADWILNARYLLARIGPGNRGISLEEPKKRPEQGPQDNPDEVPPKDSGDDSETSPEESGVAGEAAPSEPGP